MGDRLSDSIVPVDGTLRDVMVALDRGASRIALVADPDGRMVGVVTDGDVRRALLGGATIDDRLSPIMTGTPASIGPDEGRSEALDLMRARSVSAVPVLDAERRPIGLHLLHEVLDPVARTNWAIVMAGGQGTRLRPLTESVPKPMLRVAGRPILERIVLHLVGVGIPRVYLAIGYLGEIIEAHFGDGSAFGCRIEYLREDRPLGTAGALGLLPEAPTESVIVANGDLVTQADLGGLLDAHGRSGAVATIGIRRYHHSVPFGCVERDGEQVIAIEEKPTIVRDVNAGLYAVSPSLVSEVEPGTRRDMPDLIATALNRGDRIGAFEIEDDWIDVGQREQLDRARSGG
jgi:dTDP-glucose pyrophosphorylase